MCLNSFRLFFNSPIETLVCKTGERKGEKKKNCECNHFSCQKE